MGHAPPPSRAFGHPGRRALPFRFRLPAGCAPAPTVSLRICVQVDAQSGATASRQTVPVRLSDPDQIIYIHAQPEVSEGDLTGVEPYVAIAGQNGAILHFTPHAAINLNAATQQNDGRILVVILDNRVVYSPVIDGAIPGTDFIIPRGVLPAEYTALQEVVKRNLKAARVN